MDVMKEDMQSVGIKEEDDNDWMERRQVAVAMLKGVVANRGLLYLFWADLGMPVICT